MQEIYVRFIGSMKCSRNKNEIILYFTDDLDSHITESVMTHHIYLPLKKLNKVINNVYSKKKDEPLDFEELEISENDISEDLKDHLNKKILMFRLGQKIKVKAKGNRIIEFIDFYPKVGIFNPKLLYSISKKIFNIVSKSEYCDIDIKSSIVISSYESFNSLIRFPLTLERDYKIFKFVEENYDKLDKIEDLFVGLTGLGIEYAIEREKDIKKIELEKDEIFARLREENKIIRELYLQYKEFIKSEYPNELYKIFVPKIRGTVIDITEKEIKKSTIKAHKRNVKMSENKRNEILAILEEQNLEIEGLPKIITKENFDDFNWDNMTIVEGFEKNIINNKRDYINESYSNKELEKQRKLEESNYIHNSLIRKMSYNIKHNGYTPSYSRFIDLLFEDEDKKIYIFEMKSIKNSRQENNEYVQLMKAYAQLEFYPFIHEFSKDIFRTVVLSEKPKDERIINFFREKNINIIWLENDVFNTMSWTEDTVRKFLLKQVILR